MKSPEVLAFQRWHQSYIEKNEPGALNKILKEFYATVCKKDREDYKLEPLCSVYCYWLYRTEKEYKYLITLFVTEFKSWKQVLEG